MEARTELILKTNEYELKIIELEREYRRKHEYFDEEKFERFLKQKLKKDTDSLIKLNMHTA